MPFLLRWTLFASASAAVTALLVWMRLPGALMLGPMLCGILLAARGRPLQVPVPCSQASMAIIGCLIGHSVTSGTVRMFMQNWPLLLGTVLAIIGASTLAGWCLSRWSSIPGTSAILGSSAGGATAMVLMAEATGANLQLVAFMQYLRTVVVALTASGVAALWNGQHGAVAPAPVEWLPPLNGGPLALTLCVALAGTMLGRVLRMPVPHLLGPLLFGGALQAAGWVDLELPPWLRALAFATLGWRVGLGFSAPQLAQARTYLVPILVSICSLMLACGAIAALLVIALAMDPLTAYLATTPGGLDAVAIIAASSPVDLSLVMTMQTVRTLLVITLAPWLAGRIARRLAE